MKRDTTNMGIFSSSVDVDEEEQEKKLNNEVETLKKKLKETEESLNTYKQQVAANNAGANESIVKQLGILKGEKATLEQDKSVLTKQVKDLQQKILNNECSQKLIQWENDYEKLLDKKAESEDAITKTKNNEIDTLKTKINSLGVQLANCNISKLSDTVLVNKNKEIQKLENEKDEWKNKYEVLSNQLRESEDSTSAAIKDKSEAEKNLAALQATVDVLENKMKADFDTWSDTLWACKGAYSDITDWLNEIYGLLLEYRSNDQTDTTEFRNKLNSVIDKIKDRCTNASFVLACDTSEEWPNCLGLQESINKYNEYDTDADANPDKLFNAELLKDIVKRLIKCKTTINVRINEIKNKLGTFKVSNYKEGFSTRRVGGVNWLDIVLVVLVVIVAGWYFVRDYITHVVNSGSNNVSGRYVKYVNRF